MGNQREAGQSDGIPSYFPSKSVSSIALSKFTVEITRGWSPGKVFRNLNHVRIMQFLPLSSPYFVLVSNFSFCISLTFSCSFLCLFTYAKSISLLIITHLRSIFNPLYLVLMSHACGVIVMLLYYKVPSVFPTSPS